MNILHISALPIWSMDGKGGMPSLRETIEGHIRAKNDIQVILPEFDLFSPDLIPIKIPPHQPFTIHIACCFWLPCLKKIRERLIRRNKKEPYFSRWILNMTMFILLTFSLIFKSLKTIKNRPDLIYAHNQYAALAGFILSILWKRPNVTRLYGTFLADLMKKPMVALRYPTAAAGYLIPSSLLICGNDGTRGDEVAQKFRISSKRFKFWQNGISPPLRTSPKYREDIISQYHSALRKNSKWVISCSRLSGWKRIDRMLYAMKICIEKNIDCQLIIAGDGPERNTLRQTAHKLDLMKNVIWLGAVSHSEIWDLMKCSDIFMITNDVTNRCNPVYEAAWAGLPVVSIVDPSTSDILKHGTNAFLSKKDDNETLGRYLAELLCDEEIRQKFRNEQKKLSANFWTWEERMKAEVRELEKVAIRSNR